MKLGKVVRDEFRALQYSTPKVSNEVRAILNIAQAFQGFRKEVDVIAELGVEGDANGVSRAIRKWRV